MAKAKNEAKIKFTAETGEFNAAIKKASGEMSELRAELKLNEAQMKNTGSSVEGLTQKQKILENQLKSSETKTEALAQKLKKAAEIFGENSEEVSRLKVQLTNAKIAEEKIKNEIADVNREIREQAEAAERAENATESLTDRIERQERELKTLKKAYVNVSDESGETSEEAERLAREIKELSGELKDSKKAFSDASKKADELDQSLEAVEDSARDTGDGFTIAKGAVADLASNAIQMAIGKVSEFVGWLAELPEATREIRQDIATLETSFESANFTTEQATNTWKELYTVFGEDDRAVEAANLISKMAKNQEDLDKWVTITKGVWGEYQDSLPVEGLAEASNETAKTGKVTGVFADALNWSSEAASMFSKYMSEDVTTAEDAFNVALSECTTEQERQALITETLTKLYGNSAAEYEKASGAQIKAKEATAENILVQNELADTVEPLTTAWQGMKTEMVSSLLPAVEKFSKWGVDAIGWMKEHPVLMKVLGAVLGVVAAALSALIIVVTAYTVAQWAMNAAVLANPITWIIVGIVAAIAAVVAIIVVVIEYWDQIVAAVKKACSAVVSFIKSAFNWIKNNWKGLLLFITNPIAGVFKLLYDNCDGFRETVDTVVAAVKSFFKNLWSNIVSGAQSAWNWIVGIFSKVGTWVNTNIIQPVVNFFKGLWESIKSIWNGICNAIQVAIMFIGSILSAAFQIITLPFRFIWENCKQYVFAAWEWIKNKVSAGINAVKTVITTVMNAIKSAFSTAWNAIKNVVSTVWNAIKNAVSAAVNAVKSVISTAWNAVKSATTTAFNAVKSAVTTAWNAIKNAVTKVLNAIKSAITTAWNAVKSATTTAFNAVKSTATSIWNGIKNAITNVVNGVKSKISSVWNGIKSTTSNVFNSVKSTATNVWNGIKNAITKPIEAARDKIKGIIDKIKGFFSGLKLEFPKIKMPHFSIKGSFSLDPPSVPKLSIDWYKNGGIMTKPTAFGLNGSKLMVGGEAEPEAIMPLSKLEEFVNVKLEKARTVVDMRDLAEAVRDLADRPIDFYVNGRRFAEATAGDTDSVGGLRNSFKTRGLVLD